MKETVQEQLLMGNSVYTDLFRADLSIKGAFEKVSYLPHHPVVEKICRLEDSSCGERLAPGDLIEIWGSAFKQEKETTSVSLWKEALSVALRIHRINDRTLLCHIPEDIEPGLYQLSVVREGKGSILSGLYGASLEIALGDLSPQA